MAGIPASDLWNSQYFVNGRKPWQFVLTVQYGKEERSAASDCNFMNGCESVGFTDVFKMESVVGLATSCLY